MDLDPFKTENETEDVPPVPQATGGLPAQADPSAVNPPMVGGGLGDVNDGTQVPLQTSTAVPGKPMAPSTATTDPAGGSTLEGQAMDTPASGAHSERGGSG